MKILVLGGTGFLGSLLIEKLIAQRHSILLLTRRPAYGQRTHTYKVVQWPLQHEADLTAVRMCDAVINLAGAPIMAERWTKARKDLIYSSRVHVTRELVDNLAPSLQLKTFLSASAVGFYGNRKSEILTEESPRGEGFLADVCAAWEREANALAPKVRVVNLRTGVVLAHGRGFLQEMARLYRLHLGGPIGKGDSFISWIHLQDWIQSVLFTLDNTKIHGPVNLVAPEPVTNRAFSRLYSEILKEPLQLPAPEFGVRLALGERASLVIDSQNARPVKLQNHGFKFLYPSLSEALTNLYQENFTS